MIKLNTLKRIESTGIVAVVRAESEEKAINIAYACIEGGIDSVEIAFTVPGAQNVIEALVREFDEKLLVGAGTVLDNETARIAILAGAKFIVGPSFNIEVAKLCNRYQVPYMPGCMTPTEIIKAMEAGVDIIKVFPGNVFGPSFIKDIKGPLPQANLMPTGGVDLGNVEQWIKNGCIAVGIGGALTKGTKEDITNKAKKFVRCIKEARA